MNEQLIRDITTKVMRELAIPAATEAKGGAKGTTNSPTPCDAQPIPVGVSARHLHLCRTHMDTLFGPGRELTFAKELMGGQYAAAETVSIVGQSGTALKARVLGPLRAATQVEISQTDGRALGISAPMRDSGDIAGSAAITIIGPHGAVYLNEGCIVARRHIHMSPADAALYGVRDKDIVSVRICGPRGGVFSHVLVRVDASFTLEMHIDTDEANALGVAPDTLANISI